MIVKTEKKPLQFLNGGIQTSRPVNRLDQSKYLRLVNIRSYIDGLIQTRPGQQRLTIAIADTPMHSMRRLNVNAPSASQAKALIVGGGTKLYTSDALFSALTLKDSGYSGNYLSLIPHRPTQSPEPWMYVADSLRMRKVRVDGTNYPIGIAPPNTAPTAQIAAPIRTTISDFEALGAWTVAGDAGAIAVASRLTGATTITRILFDSGTTGLASVQPSVLDENIQPGMYLIVDAAGTPETVVVEQVFRSIVNTTIAKIAYDSSNVGACTIQLTSTSVGLARDGIVLINSGGGTAEAVRILSVTEGPDGLASIRTVTVNNHATTETVDGLLSFRAYFTATHAAAQTLTTNKFRSTITFATGVGYLNLVGATSLATSSNRPVQNDDEIHISIRVDNPSRLLEARVMFDVDANTNDFTRNYFFYAINPSALTQALQNTTTTFTTQQRIAQQRQLNDYYSQRRASNVYSRLSRLQGDVVEPIPFDGGPINVLPIDAPLDSTTPSETTPGDSQWTELVFKVKDLQRVGADMSRSLKNVAAIRIQFQVSATIVADVDAWWIGGTYGPDATAGSPYYYCYTGRNKATGAVSNPSPPMRSGVLPYRQRVAGTLTQHSDTQVDLLDVYRFGGALNIWRYVMTVANGATPTFTDDYPDDIITANPVLEENNYQPFPSTDVPRSGQCNANGTKIRWRSGDIFNASWGRDSLIRVNGIAYTLYSQPTVTALTVTNATNATPIVVTTSANHGLNTGDGIRIASVLGNTATNGDWVVTAVSATSFSLDTSIGNGAYTSGGTATKYDLETNENVGNLSNVLLEVPDALLLGQPLPVMWGPYGGGLGGVFMFACGDSRLPGVLFITKGNNPDSSYYRLEITSGSEVLMNGCIYDGRAYAFSTDRMYSIEPLQGGQDFVAREVANSIGLYARWGLCVGEHIYFIGKDGIYESDGGQPRSITDDNFYNLFMHDSGTTTIASADLYGTVAPDWANPNSMRLDAQKNMVTLDYKVSGVYYTLIYDTLNKRWTRDVYTDSPVAVHYTNEGEAGTNILLGGSNGILYNLTAGFTDDAGTPFNCQVTTGFDDMGDPRADKMFQDIFFDFDTNNTLITVKAYLNNNTVTASDTFTQTSAAGRATATFDLNTGSGRLGRNIGLDLQWTSGSVRLYEYHYSFYPKTDRSALRATDWNDLAYLGDKRISGFAVRADTLNTAKSFSLQYDGSSTVGPFTITHNGEKATSFAIAAPFIAKLLRVTTADTDPWLLYDVDFQFDKYPENLALVPDFSADSDLRAKWLQGFELEADTTNLPVTLDLQGDNGVVLQTFTVTHNGRVVIPYSLSTPVVTHEMRLVPTSGTLRTFNVKWIWEPEPELVTTWETQQTTHNLSQFQLIESMEVAHLSTADISLVIILDGVAQPAITIPNSSGLRKKSRVVVPSLKGKTWQYKLTSNTGFRLYLKDCEVKMKAWGSPNPYQAITPFGDIHRAVGARI